METRINKYLSEIGFCSRREADKLLEKGRITITVKFQNWVLKSKREIPLLLMVNK